MSVVIRVSTAAQLQRAITGARGGETILLAPGTYGVLAFRANPASNVTIRSADDANQAVFQQIRFNNSSNLTFAGIDIHNALAPGQPMTAAFQGNNVRNIIVQGVDVRGSLNGNANDDAKAIVFSDADRVTVLDSTVRQAHVGVSLNNVRGGVVAGMDIRDVREGINIAQADGALIERNLITGVRPNEARGEHPDFIQVHAGGTYGVSRNLVFRNNVMVQGDGPPGIQGIFINNEKVATGARHANITIENNYYEGSARHGISVYHADNVTVDNNTLLEGGVRRWTPVIAFDGVAGGVITDNIAPRIRLTASRDVVQARNVDVWDAADGGIARSQLFGHAEGSIAFNGFTPSARAGSAGFRAVGQIGDLAGGLEAQMAVWAPLHDTGYGRVALL